MRPAENYVLKPFKNEKERSFSIEIIKKAADALDSFIFNGLSKTMNIYNS
jgi:peptidyl-tRNA hydrolase